MFEFIKTGVCRKSLMKIFQDISDNYEFSAKKCHCKILAKILLNLYYKKSTPRSRKKCQQKVAKLSK